MVRFLVRDFLATFPSPSKIVLVESSTVLRSSVRQCSDSHIPSSAALGSSVVNSAGVVLVVVAKRVVVVSSRVVLVTVVLPLVPHGQVSAIGCPTALCRQTSASVAEIGRSPEGAQIQAGVQVTNETAAFKMKRQSVDTGAGPLLSGCEQAP
jgi:hypothetical protein